jgi:hypothetical protein
LSPGVSGTAEKRTPVGNRSLGEVLIAAAATFAQPEQFTCTSVKGSFKIQLIAALLVAGVLLWGSSRVIALAVLLVGLAAYLGLIRTSCAVGYVSDFGLGAACALLAHGLMKIFDGVSELISALRGA